MSSSTVSSPSEYWIGLGLEFQDNFLLQTNCWRGFEHVQFFSAFIFLLFYGIYLIIYITKLLVQEANYGDPNMNLKWWLVYKKHNDDWHERYISTGVSLYSPLDELESVTNLKMKHFERPRQISGFFLFAIFITLGKNFIQ